MEIKHPWFHRPYFQAHDDLAGVGHCSTGLCWRFTPWLIPWRCQWARQHLTGFESVAQIECTQIYWPIGINRCSFTEFQWWIVIVIVVVIESVSRQSIVIVLACYSFMVHPAPRWFLRIQAFRWKTSGPMGLVQAGPILIPIKSHENPFTCPSNSH